MSWSIAISGSKKGVKRELEKARAYGSSDQSQIDTAKKLIIDEIDAYPDSVKGVRVDASGHHDQHWRNLNIKVEPLNLALDEEESI